MNNLKYTGTVQYMYNKSQELFYMYMYIIYIYYNMHINVNINVNVYMYRYHTQRHMYTVPTYYI